MTLEFKPAKREAIPLLIGLAGGTGSGKTFSALRLARGLADGKPFAGIDTENGRMSHYADLFPELQVARIEAPFRPQSYGDAIEAAHKASFGVVVVDSASHEWYGDGGCLDWHDELMGTDQRKNLSAWIEPKREHKRFVTRLLQLNAHVILCFRAEPKVEAVRGENGRVEIKPKRTLPSAGLDGWIPITEKNLPFEMTCSFLLMPDAPGLPRPMKLPEQMKPLVPLDKPLDESVGHALAAWAAGSVGEPEQQTNASAQTLTSGSPADPELVEQAESLARVRVAFAVERGNTKAVEKAIADNRAAHEHELQVHVDWLQRQIEIAQAEVVPA